MTVQPTWHGYISVHISYESGVECDWQVLR